MSLEDAAPFVVSAWNMDEEISSGVRGDSIGDDDLQDLNDNVGFDVGLLGNAAAMPGSGGFFQLFAPFSENLALDNVSFSVSGWFKFDQVVDNNQRLLARQDSGSFTSDLVVTVDGAGELGVGFVDTNGLQTFIALPEVPALSVWHLICLKHDLDNNVVGISVDGQPFLTQPFSPDGLRDSGFDFFVGSAPFSSNLNGLVDDIGYIKRYAFSDGDVLELWNSGSGVAVSDWEPDSSSSSSPSSSSSISSGIIDDPRGGIIKVTGTFSLDIELPR